MALPRYRLYVDEVGNDDITNTHNEQHRYLGLAGIIMRQEYVRDEVTPVFTRCRERPNAVSEIQQLPSIRGKTALEYALDHGKRCRLTDTGKNPAAERL